MIWSTCESSVQVTVDETTADHHTTVVEAVGAVAAIIVTVTVATPAEV